MKTLGSGILMLALVLASQSFSATTAIAAPIYITPSAASFGGGSYNPVSRLIDGSGLSGGSPYAGVVHQDGGDSNSFKGPTADLLNNAVILQLGASYNLTDIYVWNYSHPNGVYTGRDTKTIDVSLSTDGINYGAITTINLTSAGGASSGSEPLQSFSLTGAATHVKLQVTAVYATGETGLGEVRFAGDDAVPEPASFVLAGIGLMGLGWFGIRRRKK